ncbi:alpha/beta hydrolase [Arachidicoccus sp.]|uniref:alpha/beta hydrolase n=1 Tax=Arachidicoccus sp. TaxID=1872624 RepID=UPI003D1AEE1F
MLLYENGAICYGRFGTGNATCFCFHGYSNDSSIFEVLNSPLFHSYTFIAIDLPYHGDTKWSRSLLTPEKLNDIILSIIEKEQLPKTFSLLGFSLGGRVAMSAFLYAPHLVERMILLAPDGLYKGFWYKMVVQTQLGNKLMAYFLSRPEKAIRGLRLCKKVGLINNRFFLNAQGFVSSKRESTLLYARWISMRKLHPNLKKLGEKIKVYQLPVKMVFGKADIITPAHNATYLVNYAKPFIDFEQWNAGHMLLKEKYIAQLETLFK